jgi:nucleotide-binding universal stress UspA family protein
MLQTLSTTRQTGVQSLATGYKDILVHLDGTLEDETRLAHAEALACAFGAHLIGLYTNKLPDIADYPTTAGLMAYAELADRLHAGGAIIQKRLAKRLQRSGAANELRKIEAAPVDMRRAVATEARLVDLFVASCPRETARQWRFAVEEALFEGGRSVLLAPEGVRPRDAIRTIVIGWVNTSEAARAVAEALPLLQRAGLTEIVCVEEGATGVDRALARSDIAAHLDRHGVAVNISMISDATRDAAAAILDKAHRVSADLIVTGAYGHSRFREWILGGVTHDLIARSDIPLLMAH